MTDLWPGADYEAVLAQACPDLDAATVRAFVSRLDADYFARFGPAAVAAHMRMARALDPARPVLVDAAPRQDGQLDLVVVAYDYSSAFSIICGVLTASGLDIQAGHVYTFSREAAGSASRSRGRRRPAARGADAASRAKIVDVFTVRPTKAEAFDAPRIARLAAELTRLLRLVGDGRLDEARGKLHVRLGEYLGCLGLLPGMLLPVDVSFDNDSSPEWTVLDVRGADTPAFLYAFSNALAMRRVYIHKVDISAAGRWVCDRFFISHLEGGKIVDAREQTGLRMAVSLIKQFTHLVAHAPDPATAIRHFDQLLDRALDEHAGGRALTFLAEPGGLKTLARLLGSSEFLWEDFLRLHVDNVLPLLEHLRERPLRPGKGRLRGQLQSSLSGCRGREEAKRALNAFKDAEVFFTDLKRLLDPGTDLTSFSAALTDLAEAVVEEACGLCDAALRKRHGVPRVGDGAPCPLAVFGLGKFGGRELGYASDLELIFVYGADGRTDGPDAVGNGLHFDAMVRDLLSVIEAREDGMFQIDLRLRPHGGGGPLTTPLARVAEYYSPEGDAAPFERQALVKLRFVAGDPRLGQEVESLRDRFVYSDVAWNRDDALHLRARQMRELVAPGRRSVKYSAGGLVDIEYAVQCLQIQHGARLIDLRTPNTLDALEGLRRHDIVTEGEWAAAREAYLFLRALTDGLRMVRGSARDMLVPSAGSDDLIFLARRLGYADADWAQAGARLLSDIESHMTRARDFYARCFGVGAASRPGSGSA